MNLLLPSCAVMPDSMRPHGLQHSRLPCPSPSPGVCPSSCPSNWWCHPNISSSVAPFCCLQSFPPSGSFPISQYFTSDGQSNWHFRFSISPSNEYAGLISFKIDWFDLLAVRWTLKSLLQHHSLKASIFQHSALFVIQLWHLYMSMERPVVLTLWIFISKVMSLLFNTLPRFVITFLPRSRSLLISWLPSPSTVILEPKKIYHCFRCFPM